MDGRSCFVVKTAPRTSPEIGPSMRQDSAIGKVKFNFKNVQHAELSVSYKAPSVLNLKDTVLFFKIVVDILHA